MVILLFQILNPMIGYFEFFLMERHLFLQVICTLYCIIMLIYPFCQLIDLIFHQRPGFLLLGMIADQADNKCNACRDAG